METKLKRDDGWGQIKGTAARQRDEGQEEQGIIKQWEMESKRGR